MQPELPRLLTVPKRTGPDTGFHYPRRTCARMGFVKGQLPKCALELLGHANVVFEPDGRSPFMPGLSADKVMGGTPPPESLRVLLLTHCRHRGLRLAPDGEYFAYISRMRP